MTYRVRKTIFTVALLLTVFASLTFTAFAHSGGTDSDGGHTNHSTGEYHWHHGYSAHQHQDKDGDGYPEYCPYRIQKDESYLNDNDCGRADCDIVGDHGHIEKDKQKEESFNWGKLIGYGFALLLFCPILLEIIESIVKHIKKK